MEEREGEREIKIRGERERERERGDSVGGRDRESNRERCYREGVGRKRERGRWR